MATSVTMPALGESVSEGTVTRWLKQEGDQVNADEPLLEVSTDKVDTEIPSPVSGVLQKIVVAEDETVDVGAELAIIGDGSEDGGSGDSGQSQQSGGQEQQGQREAAPEQQAQQGQQQEEQPQQAQEAAPAQQEAPQQEAPQQDAPQQDAPQQQASSGDEGSGDGGSGGGGSGGGGGTSVTMPALGESVSEGTVTRWLKQEGDQVNADEPLLEVSTDKVDTEIPSPVSGVLQKIVVAEDETVDVGAELAIIGDGSEDGGSGDSGQSQQSGGQEQQGQQEAEPEQQAQQGQQQE